MKSAKTMLALAKANAIDKGIRIKVDDHGKKMIGFAFSLGEITTLYQMDGFTTKTMRRHIDTWAQLGLVVPAGNIWFVKLSSEDVNAITELDNERRDNEQRGVDGCYYIAEAVA